MAQHHKYSIAEIENMIVFERDLYMEMLIAHLQEQEEKAMREQEKAQQY